MRLCVCGGRDYFNRNKIYEVLDYAFEHKEFVLITGGSTGADTLAAQWARDNGVIHELYPADWKTHGKAAGPIRNRKMAESGLDILIAFPGGKGTADMIRQCKKRKIKVVEVEDEDCDIG